MGSNAGLSGAMSTMLTFDRHAFGKRDRIAVAIDNLVVAGWAGRDEEAIRHHIEELAAIGVPRPSSTPVFYRNAVSIVTQTEHLQVLGPDTSGEVEPVVIALADGLWVTVGSDHTDRKAETHGIALSKQLCGKVVGRTLWKLEEVAPHWDQLILRAYGLFAGKRALYQEGPLTSLRRPEDLVQRYAGDKGLAPGTMMMGGTMSAIGGIRPSDRFEMELHDPVLKRTITHAYDIEALPIVT